MDWPVYKVEDIASKDRYAMSTGPFGSAISSKYFVAQGIPVIRGKNLSEHCSVRLSDKDLVFLEPHKASEFERSTVRAGDLIFTCWGTIGQVGLIDEKAGFNSYVISNKQMKLTVDESIADSLFFYYQFSSPDMVATIQGQSIGSSVPGFNLGQLKQLEVLVPPLEDQRRIAHVLGTLDDKIELNRQMNATLEAIAQAIFKSWFVDFDGHDDLVESDELGLIPRGWEVKSLSKVAKVNPESLSPNRDSNVSIDYIDISSVTMGELDSTTHYARLTDAPSRARRKIAHGDTLWSQVRPNRKSYYFVQNPPETWIASTGFSVLRPKIPNCFFHQTVIQNRFVDFLVQNATGSAYPAANTATFKRAPILVPPMGLMERYQATVEPLREKIAANVEQSRTLTELRDTLLPKLISGELRVPEALEIVEESEGGEEGDEVKQLTLGL